MISWQYWLLHWWHHYLWWNSSHCQHHIMLSRQWLAKQSQWTCTFKTNLTYSSWKKRLRDEVFSLNKELSLFICYCWQEQWEYHEMSQTLQNQMHQIVQIIKSQLSQMSELWTCSSFVQTAKIELSQKKIFWTCLSEDVIFWQSSDAAFWASASMFLWEW